MGYESKVTLVLEMSRFNDVWNKVLVSLDMGKVCEEGWRELFREPLVGDICLGLYGDYYVDKESGQIEQGYTKEDPYGHRPTQATVESVYEWCREHYKTCEIYSNKFMVGVLRDMLARAMKSKWPLKVVHTGY